MKQVQRVPMPVSPSGGLVAAHRGLTAGGPAENTLAAFERAIGLGAEMLELDVRRGQDGVMVVCHERAVVGRNVPTLGQVVALAAGRTKLFVELKEAGYEQMVLDEVRARFGPGDFMMASFLPEVVQRLKQLAPVVCVGLGVGWRHQLGLALASEAGLRGIGADFVSYNRALDWLGFGRRLGRAAMPAAVWTVNGARRLAWYSKNRPTTLIVTDDLHLALSVKKRINN